jgi:ribosome-binding protein aMBF1 (putative translation factor)
MATGGSGNNKEEGRGTARFSEIRRPETPERRARIDAIKRAMADAGRLADLRTSRGVTQVELAERLGKSQGNISDLERRDDVYLSSLREYVEALGGRLEVAAVFDEERHSIRLGGRNG